MIRIRFNPLIFIFFTLIFIAGCSKKVDHSLLKVPSGKIRLILNNKTNKWNSNQIFFAIIARNDQNEFVYVKKDGTLDLLDISDNTAPNHLSKNGESYSNYFMKLDEVSEIFLPKLSSGRLFIGIESPLYIKVLEDINGDVGFAGPNPNNANDPNIDIYFDFIEFTFNDLGFFGNTTQVDQFGFPIVMTLLNKDGDQQTVGITESRHSIFSNFISETPLIYHQLSQGYRIQAPYKGGFEHHSTDYFDSYIDAIWATYKTEDLVIHIHDVGTITGRVGDDNQFVFTKTATGETARIIRKPTTQEVFECSGVLASGGSFDKVIQAQFSAALNRHIVEDPDHWGDDSYFYLNSPANFYSAFWHRHSIDNKAYGFAYDDVNDFSTLIQDPNPSQLEIDIRW